MLYVRKVYDKHQVPSLVVNSDRMYYYPNNHFRFATNMVHQFTGKMPYSNPGYFVAAPEPLTKWNK